MASSKTMSSKQRVGEAWETLTEYFIGDNQLSQGLRDAFLLVRKNYKEGGPSSSTSVSLSPPLARRTSTAHLPQITSLQRHISSMDDKDKVQTLLQRNHELERLLVISNITGADAGDSNWGISSMERETLRAVFDSFDRDGDGWIEVKELMTLHQRLGEPLTEEEAQQAMNELDPDGHGAAGFDEFLLWWHKSHDKGKSKYGSKFKTLCAKLKPGDFTNENIKLTRVGKEGTTEFRIYFYYESANKKLKQISPWHDIPLYDFGISASEAKIFNFVCEIPKWTRAKFEITTTEVYNPIKQDVKNGNLRYYKWGDMMFNYGAFPQTWEDPNHIPSDTGKPGDNDPVDVIEIGTKQLPVGSVTRVKILGVLPLLDSGETDWKVLSINIKDPLAGQLHDVHDIDTLMPNAINVIRNWLRDYKGKDHNKYALGGECKNNEYATGIVLECHEQWKQTIWTSKTTVEAAARLEETQRMARQESEKSLTSSPTSEQKTFDI